MEAKATTEAESGNWLKYGCPHQAVAINSWLMTIKRIGQGNIDKFSPENRAKAIAAAIIHNHNVEEICRMTLMANQKDQTDSFTYYTNVLRLLHAQVTDSKTRGRIVFALTLAPIEDIEKIYEQERSYYEQDECKKGKVEAYAFCEICKEIIRLQNNLVLS